MHCYGPRPSVPESAGASGSGQKLVDQLIISISIFLMQFAKGVNVLIDAERDPKRTIFKKAKQSCPNHFQSVRGNQFWIFSASAHASAGVLALLVVPLS